MPNKPNSLIELAATYEADFNLRVEKLPTDELEYVYEIMYAMAWELRGKNAMLKDRDGTITMMRNRQEKDLAAASEIETSLRNQLDDINNTRQQQMLAVACILDNIVDMSLTHGQKNGAIMLCADLLRRSQRSDLYLGDIPF